jgi:hypothetical protein
MSSVVFNGPLLRALKSAIRLNDQATIWSGSADPTATATFGRQGDIYIKFGAGAAWFQKTTADGTDTNWTRGAPIAPNAISGAEIRLDNDESLRARNAADNGDVNILKVNASDRILFASLPQVASDPVAGNDLARLSYIATQLGLKISSTEKGANNGVATLDSGGKIPVAQLPSSVMTYEGTWNATTNTPTLADGTGDAGMIYLVSVAGTQDLGSGNITFAAGDWVVYNGSIWQKSINSNAVVSVNSQTGAVVLTSADISEVTNLYFTDERAQDAVGGILANTTTINLSYSDGTPSISAAVNSDSITNTQINSAAAIAYSKLNLSSSIVNADVAAAAAIAVNKLAAVTASKAVASDSSGFLVAASTTAAELDFVSGVTSAIQTQLGSKVPDTRTVNGHALSTDVTVNISELGSVSLASPAINQTLVFDGTNWVNSTVPAIPGSQKYVYATSTASDIGTYNVESFSVPASTEVDASVAVTSGTSPVLIKAFATDSAGLGVTSIPAGTWLFNTYGYVSAGTTSTIQVSVYKRTSGGTETLLFSSSTPTLSTAVSLFTVSSTQPAFSVGLTDRLVVKYLATNSSGTSRTVHLVYEDSVHATNVITTLISYFQSLTVIGNAAIGGNTVVTGSLAANNVATVSSTIVSAAGTTTLTVNSTGIQKVTGTTTQTIQLPNATTLSNGWRFEVDNNSTGVVTIKDAGSNTLFTMSAGAYVIITATDVTTSNGVWDYHWHLPSSTVAGTAGIAVTGTLSATSTVTGSNLSGSNTGDQTITLTGDVTGSGTGSFAASIAANHGICIRSRHCSRYRHHPTSY